MQHRTKSLNKFGSGKNAPVSPCQHTLLSSSARNASSASESTSAISRQVPREVNASSKDRLGRQVAYQGEEVACLGEAQACPAVAEGGKTCLSLKARAIKRAQKPDATAPPFATQLRRRLKFVPVCLGLDELYCTLHYPYDSSSFYWNVATGLLVPAICMLVLGPRMLGSLMKIERILLLSFVGRGPPVR